MTSAIRQNPLIPMLVCACGWLFGQGMYQLMRPVVLDNVENGFNRVISHDSYRDKHEFVHQVYTKRDSGSIARGEITDSKEVTIEV